LASHPDELDSIARGHYDTIYKGNIADPEAHASSFATKYQAYLFKGPEFLVDPIVDTEFMETCQEGPFTAGGVDGWSPRDLTLFPLAVFTWWSYLLNAIEGGKPWPQGVLHGRTSFMAKHMDKECLDITEQRLLLLLSTFYRKWSKHRLRCVHPWIDTWKLDGLFAGIPGRGAEDAWWITSIVIETARMSGIPLSGGAADIWRCFDQISRTLLYYLLIMGGFPTRILDAYMKFHSDLSVRNLLAGGYGQPYNKTCSIPQGCPWSMLFIAFLLRPIILLTEVPGTVITRILADDILLTAMGQEHIQAFANSFGLMLGFLHDMGSIISAKKSYLFSTEVHLKQFLK
ncbi:MAG: reverse transcriptase domain-containing protein, partial [Candidatus Peribacteraceae bacterium]|nr:reverse transcriptase domain-containing protein [Candidatus Peribacteraceae bacterium]